ncbi:MAG: glycosylasparaginase [Haliscomenobacteraceae bacterium CHB4]|nr:N(4)-(Beta-N-acetylglucosaminyl)-L-asparaginase [Saprospiraceae bacterium]MCE7924008.1 glycosylasparaginase [Haliscomenobacteraceae bacterium CHB4]
MNSRRKFLQNTLFGSIAAGNAAFWAKTAEQFDHSAKDALPAVIATWGPNVKATAAAWQVLSTGGRALDAVEAGVRVPEADPADTSVGYGGLPDRDGNVTLDACIMDEFGNAGSVSFLQHIMHPISVARRVMEKTPHVMLVGEGALQFALNEGFKKENLLTDNARKAWEDWKVKSEYKPQINVERHDTIGMIALDKQQRIAGACTTSGLAFKMHGRVGDSPVIGAGMFADNEVGGAAATGLGELVLRTLGSFLVVEEMRRGAHPQKAVETAVKRIASKYPEQTNENQVGFIAMDKKGRHGAFGIHPGFNYVLYQRGENKVFEAASLKSR